MGTGIGKILLFLLCALLLTGCGAASRNAMGVESAAVAETWAADAAANIAAGTESIALPENRKFVITMDLSAETENLDVALEALQEALEKAQGYVQEQNIHNGSAYSGSRYRRASLTLRIPVDGLETFTEQVSSHTNLVSSSRSTEDVTLQYVDTQGRITALETEQTRLLELLAQAESMSDLLEIETRLTEVRSQLESYTSQMRVLDNQVDYATVYLSISQVTQYTPVEEQTRLEKIATGFVTSLKNLGTGILDLACWLLIDLPYLAAGALAGFGIYKLLKKRKKNKANKNPREEKQN